MGRTASRRRRKRLKRLDTIRRKGPMAWNRKAGEMLEQWQRQADFRARHFTYDDGHVVPTVWSLVERKLPEAEALGVLDELVEVCRQAVAKHANRGRVAVGKSIVNASGRPIVRS